MTTPATGFTFNYTDPASSLNLPNAWIVIYETKEINPSSDTMFNRVVITYFIFDDDDCFTEGKNPVFTLNLTVSKSGDPTNWATYFDESVLLQEGKDLSTESYAALLAYLTDPSSFTNN